MILSLYDAQAAQVYGLAYFVALTTCAVQGDLDQLAVVIQQVEALLWVRGLAESHVCLHFAFEIIDFILRVGVLSIEVGKHIFHEK